jgi:hypothetical protein
VTFLEGQAKSPSQLLPHVHRIVSLLKRWLLGTHHGGVTHEHLDYYLDEFTFRFNRVAPPVAASCSSVSFSRRWPSSPPRTSWCGRTTSCRWGASRAR